LNQLFLQLKNFKKRFISSALIIVFVVFYFLFLLLFQINQGLINKIFVITFLWVLNFIILNLINYELIKLFKFKKKWLLYFSNLFFISIIFYWPFIFFLTNSSCDVIKIFFNFSIKESLLVILNSVCASLIILSGIINYYCFFLTNKRNQTNYNFRNNCLYLFLTFLIIFAFKGLFNIALKFQVTSAFFILLLCFSFDSSSYFFGSWLGKKKIAPKISPNKTIKGVIYGSIFTLLIMITYCLVLFLTSTDNKWKFLFYPNLNLGNKNLFYFLEMFFLIILAINFAFLGDLFFSFIKRKFKIKDFSNLIKGHGGILDRIDSILAVCLILSILLWIFN